MASTTWVIWSWDDRNGVWMEVAEGSKKEMEAALSRKQAAAARLLPSARYAMTRQSEPPTLAPDDLR